MNKVISQLDSDGYFLGPVTADESPLEPGVYLIPGGCVDVLPIEVPGGKRAKFNQSELVLEDIPAAPTGEPPLPPTQEQIKVEFSAVIQQRLDDFARTRNYDGILSACTYATSGVPKFASEGQYCVNLRDATWSATYTILAAVEGGTRAMPASIDDIAADLPALVWQA